jgi:hypothetical protein
MTWVLTGQILQRNLTISKLVPVRGIIDDSQEVVANVKKKLLDTQVDKEFRIKLKGSSEYFRIMEVYKYSGFAHQISAGDTAELFIRPKWLVPLGLGKRNDVFHLVVNGVTVFNVQQTRRNADGIIAVALVVIPGAFLLARWIKNNPS